MDIRLKIVQLVEEKGLSINALSEKSGVRRQSISHFLAGGNLHIKNLEKMLQALGYELSINDIKSSITKTESMFQKRISVSKDQIQKFCIENKIRYMAVFGSILTKDFGENSDIDIMIEMERPISFFELMNIESRLKKLFATKHDLDVVTPSSISPLIKERIDASKEVLYEKAA